MSVESDLNMNRILMKNLFSTMPVVDLFSIDKVLMKQEPQGTSK